MKDRTSSLLLRCFLPMFLVLIGTIQRSTAQDMPTTDWATYNSLGDWFVDTNWTNGVPNSNTDARIRRSGFALINTPSAAAHYLYVGYTLNGQVGDGTLQLSQAGSATPGSLQVASLYVGSQDPYTATRTRSAGTLVVEKGATIGTAGVADLEIGSGYQSTGTMTVQDPNSVVSLYLVNVGYGPNCLGTLTLQNGGRVNCALARIGSANILTPQNGESPPNGSLTVTGAGSQLAVHGLDVGYAGQGTVLVSNGGALTDNFNSGRSADSTIAAYAGNPNSAVTVTDAGSSWVNAGSIDVGGYDRAGGQTSSNGGVGILRVQSGGLVQCARLNAFANCEVTVDNGSSLTAGLKLVGGGGVMATGATPGDIFIGRNSAGRMEVRGGGTAWSSRGLLGLSGNTSGSALVADAGSKWANSSSIYVGGSGSGTLDVLNGGAVISGGDSFIGPFSNGVGNTTVSGPGSSWSVAGNLYIGGSASGAGGTGTLQLENGGAFTASGATLYSNGYLNLSGNFSLKAPLTFQGGAIQFVSSNNTNFPNDFTVGTGGLRVYTYGHPSVVAGSITGPGGLTKGGSPQLGLGTLTLTGASNYTGATALNTGTLLVNGSITSAVTVNNGATLGGNGSVGPVIVNSGGIVSPGNSPGRLTVNGDYTQNSGAILNMELGGASPGAGGYDQLVVTGKATLGGTLNISLVNGFKPAVGDTFNIITSGSETGSFSSINTSGFTVNSSTSGGGFKVTVATVQPGVPTITSVNAATATENQPFSYQITATDSPTSFGAQGLPAGLTVNPATGLISGAPTVSGSFNITVTATNNVGTGSGILTITIIHEPTTLANISTRLAVQTDDNVLIAGFIITGTQSKKVIVRGLGPSLPVSGALADPVLELYDNTGTLVATNDNWKKNGNAADIQSTGVAPSQDAEAALLASLAPGSYSAIERGANGGTGVGLLELYDLDRNVDSKLANISTRGLVLTGDNILIGGFIVRGSDSQRVIVRALGPSLPVTGALADPTLELRDQNGELVRGNDNWKTDQKAEIVATGIPPSNDLESAIVATLPPAAYTSVVHDAKGHTGVALVEIYALDQ